jgi:GT2 family glycosyltransferase
MSVADDGDTAVASEVGVVVVTYFSAGVIDELLDSLPTGMAGTSWRLVVVDNGSTDDTVQRVRDRGHVAVEMGRNAGYSAAINEGIRRLGDVPYVLVLNPDIEMHPGAARALVDAGASDPVGVVAPQTRHVDGTLAYTLRRSPSIRRTLSIAIGGRRIERWLPGSIEEISDPDAYAAPCNVDWAVGAALLIRREVFDDIGLWDESFFLYSEETDFCLRARRAGWLVRYEPTAVVVHEGGGGVQQPRLRSMMVVNRVRLYARDHSRPRGWLFWAASVIHEAARAATGFAPARAALAALVSPRRRPAELGCSESLLPR